jgi:hypothetical protein
MDGRWIFTIEDSEDSVIISVTFLSHGIAKCDHVFMKIGLVKWFEWERRMCGSNRDAREIAMSRREICIFLVKREDPGWQE